MKMDALPESEKDCRYWQLRAGSQACGVHRLTADGHLSAVLGRYAAVWTRPSPFAPGPPALSADGIQRITKTIGEPTSSLRHYAFLYESKHGPWVYAKRLAQLPFFSRLNCVKQLSTTSIALNIEATHNRLSHLLGTVDMAARMLRALCSEADEAALPTPPEAAAVMIYALIHDAYHGPFGHSLDHLGGLIASGGPKRRIDKTLLLEEVNKAKRQREGDVHLLVNHVARWMMLERNKPWEVHVDPEWVYPKDALILADELTEVLSRLIRPRDARAKTPEKYWLCEIVDGPVDADRLDFLLRDTRCLYYPTRIDEGIVAELIEGARLVLGPLVEGTMSVDRADVMTVGSKRQVYRIHWDGEQKETIEALLKLRSELYERVYEAPPKRAFDEMLTHALMWIVRDQAPGSAKPGSIELKDLLRQLVRVTDDELFHFLYEVGTTPRHTVAMALAHDVAVGRAFSEVWRLAIPFESLAVAKVWTMVVSAKWAQERKALNEEANEDGVESVEGDGSHGVIAARALRRALSALERIDAFADHQKLYGLVYLLETLFGHSFVGREFLERALWTRLLDDPSPEFQKAVDDAVLDIYEGAHWSCSGEDSDTIRTRNREHPLVFISIPWVPRLGVSVTKERLAELLDLKGSEVKEEVETLESLVKHVDPQLVTWDREQEPLYHREGVALDIPRDYARKRLEMHYPVSVYVPPRLTLIPGFRDKIGQLMIRLIPKWSLV